MWGEVLRTTPQTYNLLAKPTPVATNTTATKVAAYISTKAIWRKKNMQGLGLIQATVSGVIWQDYQTLGTTKEVLDALETAFGAVEGASTYLQLVNIVKIQFTNLTDLLPQIQSFQDNYNRITLNDHSRLSKDLATFMFCLSLPDSYKSTAQQYLDNILVITSYKYSSFGVMFYLKKESDEFAAFKQYKAWAERQPGTMLKCR